MGPAVGGGGGGTRCVRGCFVETNCLETRRGFGLNEPHGDRDEKFNLDGRKGIADTCYGGGSPSFSGASSLEELYTLTPPKKRL